MSRDYKVCLEDILEAAAKIRRFTEGMSFENFLKDERTVDAVLRNLEVIGEAAKQVPEEVRPSVPVFDWRKVTGLRDILIHQYFGVDLAIIWDIVQTKLPALEREIKNMFRT